MLAMPAFTSAVLASNALTQDVRFRGGRTPQTSTAIDATESPSRLGYRYVLRKLSRFESDARRWMVLEGVQPNASSTERERGTPKPLRKEIFGESVVLMHLCRTGEISRLLKFQVHDRQHMARARDIWSPVERLTC
jgi:hypothetical protein